MRVRVQQLHPLSQVRVRVRVLVLVLVRVQVRVQVLERASLDG